MRELVGRSEEKTAISAIIDSAEPHLLALTGRRRIGKTFLVRSYFNNTFDFELTGIHNGDLTQQLYQFDYALRQHEEEENDRPVPSSWMEAFQQLIAHLEGLKTKKKLVVFIDEFPWLDTPRSNFTGAFDWFWNHWASRKNIVVIICGSAASWMIRKVINNRGGLHNRVTKRIHLQPFTLHETELFLKQKRVVLTRYQIATLYMALGGVPHYLNEIQPGESAIQAIQRICFQKNGLLVNEFNNLYTSLFGKTTGHRAIVEALAAKRSGLSRKELVKQSGLKDGGTFSTILEELEWSGFIDVYAPFGKLKKDKLIRLTDEYSLFYLTFIRGQKNVNWEQLAVTPTWTAWSGYTFESLCLKHLRQLKAALGIAGVYTECSSFTIKGNKTTDGTQIDLLIDRKDQVINLCEMKFSEHPFVVSKSYAAAIQQKAAVFKYATGTRKALFPTLVTTFGILPNEHSTGLIIQQVQLDDLFQP